MELLVSASFIASFFAGVAALFAPCCITVLLPTYFASIFKQKTKVFLMTFVYFLGLLVIFVPLGLGVSALAQFFSQFHNLIFSLGGIFLVFLGLSLLLGRQLSLPFSVHPRLKNYDLSSVFVLGIFSGVATICCAPVLAGVLALSVLPGSVFLGLSYVIAYVLGMVVPLFIIAAFLDKVNFTQKFFVFRKTVNYNLLGQKIYLPFSSFFAGLMFFILGIVILYLSRINALTAHTSYQVTINIYLAKLVKSISVFTGLIPEPIWALFFVGIFLLIIKIAISEFINVIKRGKGGEH
ncbi:MAG: hypothetical protein M1405_03490 [Patescibacteria group bacterium]|nr:hypothetical protein [Patescibacteria group bacterium]